MQGTFHFYIYATSIILSVSLTPRSSQKSQFMRDVSVVWQQVTSESSSHSDVSMMCHNESSVSGGVNESGDSGKGYPGADFIHDFSAWYIYCHGAIALAICIFGVVANVLNIIVLTRREMLSSTNCLLTALAVSDGCTMLAYAPFALYFYLLHDPVSVSPQRNTLHAARFLLFYAGFSVFTHTVSIWLTVTLAAFRYIFIRCRSQGGAWRSIQRAKLCIGVVFCTSLVICVPNFTTVDLTASPVSANDSRLIWEVSFRVSACDSDATDEFLFNFNFWVQAMLVKFLPCLCLAVLSGLLIRSLREADKRHKKLHASRRKAMRDKVKDREKGVMGSFRGNCGSSDKRANRTTAMLLTVVLLFLATELPQGVLSLFSGLLEQDFFTAIYSPLGDAMDILVLLNSSVNFIIYCAMSKQFRVTFTTLFCPRASKLNVDASVASL